MIRLSIALAAFSLAALPPLSGLAGEPSAAEGRSGNIEGLDPSAIVEEVVEDQRRALSLEMRQGWRRYTPVRPANGSVGVRLAQDGSPDTPDGS